jgi:NOL1/NOP2/fmu family ribosome biogenesis protein
MHNENESKENEINKIAREWFKHYFGISLPDYIKFKESKEKIICYTHDFFNYVNIENEHFGITALKKIKDGYKPSTNFLQIYGAMAIKNVVYLNKELSYEYSKGKSIEIEKSNAFIDEKTFKKFVAVCFNNHCLGCGFLVENKLINQIPKARRV